MKHLLTNHNIYVLKKCAEFTISPGSNLNSQDTFTSKDSGVELDSQDTTYSQS